MYIMIVRVAYYNIFTMGTVQSASKYKCSIGARVEYHAHTIRAGIFKKVRYKQKRKNIFETLNVHIVRNYSILPLGVSCQINIEISLNNETVQTAKKSFVATDIDLLILRQ